LQKKVEDAIELTKNNTKIDVILAFNYGGRDEIVCALKKLIQAGTPAEEVNIQSLSDAMFTAGTPDPDIVIRTSGEQRTSNFLVWQSVYSEWFFPKTYWPDFSEADLLQIIEDFNKRDRRFGGLSKK
jgi:undecaprenyl diphosphate synthase